MKKLKTIIAFSLGIVCCYFLYRSTNFNELFTAVKHTNITILAFFVPLFLVNMIIRSHRWRLLFPRNDSPPLKRCFDALMLGNFANTVLPSRGGDLLRAVVLGQISGVAKTEVLGTVLVERVADMCFASLLMLVMFPFFNLPPEIKRGVIILGGCAILFMTVICLLGKSHEQHLKALLPKFLPEKISSRLKSLIGTFLRGFHGIIMARQMVPFVLDTILIWVLEIAALWLVIFAVGGSGSLLSVPALFLISIFGSMIPGPPGQVGVFEYIVASGAKIVGISNGPAIAIIWHGISLLCIAVSGLIITLFYREKTEKHEEFICE